MNEIEVPTAATERQQAYLRHLAARAHEAGMPHLHIASFTRAQASEWIDYLRMILEAEERVREILARAKQEAERVSAPYLVTPPRYELPESYRPPWQELPRADDHEHLVGSIMREDGVEEAVCVLCGVSA